MIEGRVLKFGYGDIAVGYNAISQKITFQQFKPPTECGENVSPEVEFISDKIFIKISYDEYKQLSYLLSKVKNKEISKFYFKEYEFNFHNYNEKSIEVCLKNLNFAMQLYFMALAC